MPVTLPTTEPVTARDSAVTRPRIMLVDDEPALLMSMRRQLSSRFRVETSDDPVDALARVADIDDLSVVVSDMRMPVMNGASFLRGVRERAPDVTRVLLTGYAEVDTAVAAVNEGQIFRFLSKPISPEAFAACLDDAVRQHALVTAERELLERTLRSSVMALVETLAMANPMAFARATRIARRVTLLGAVLDVEDQWAVEVAAMLTHIAAVELPPGVNERLHRGQELTTRQAEAVAALPARSVALIADIPRLDAVRRIIRWQCQRYDGRGPVEPDAGGDAIPLGARMLRAVTDYDALEARGMSVTAALQRLCAETGLHDPDVLEALRTSLADLHHETRYVQLADLEPGQVLARDLVTVNGTLLVSRGQQLTGRIVNSVRNWAGHTAIEQPIAVRAGPDADPPA